MDPAVDASEIPNKPPGMYNFSAKSWDFNYQPQLVNAGFLNHQPYGYRMGQQMRFKDCDSWCAYDFEKPDTIAGNTWPMGFWRAVLESQR